jgi:wobble nucleotide-excising tRNase
MDNIQDEIDRLKKLKKQKLQEIEEINRRIIELWREHGRSGETAI